ncbi:hypothetical protein N9A56_03445 [Planktomarina temperata]|nr:hypothetical protein [Planktomarina temperata]
MDVHIVTACFGDRFTDAILRFEKQLTDLDVEHRIYTRIFKDSDLSYLGDHKPEFFSWKPALIMHMFNIIKDEDILIYLDIGCEFNTKTISNAINTVEECGTIFLDNGHRLINWIDPKMLGSGPFVDIRDEMKSVAAGTLFLKKDENTAQILKDWNYWAQIDKNKYIISNAKNHRHDQSILSSILNWHDAKIINDNCYYTEEELLTLEINDEAFCFVFRNKTRFEFIKYLNFLRKFKNFIPKKILINLYVIITKVLRRL